MKERIKDILFICLFVLLALSGGISLGLAIIGIISAPGYYQCYKTVQTIPHEDYILGMYDCVVIIDGKPVYVNDIIDANSDKYTEAK